MPVKTRQGAALERKKFFADPVMVVTIVLLTVLLALFILYPLAMLLLDTPQIAYYLIVLAITGTISGVFIGLCGALLIKHVPYQKFFK